MLTHRRSGENYRFGFIRTLFLLIIPCIVVCTPCFAQSGFLAFPLRNAQPLYHGWYYFYNVKQPSDGYHGAIDIRAPADTEVLAAADGWAIASCQPKIDSGTRDTYGNFALMDHGNGFSTLYAHLTSISLPVISQLPCDNNSRHRITRGGEDIAYAGNVFKWTRVNRGEVIGRVGKTGTTYDHLHFETARNVTGSYAEHINNRIDPYGIYKTAQYYPPAAQCSSPLPEDFLWSQCPPGVGLPGPCLTAYKHLLIVYPNTDVTYLKDGVTRRFVGTMSNSLKTTVINAFSNLPNLISGGSAGAASSTQVIVEIPNPVTRIMSLGGNNYWLSDLDIQSDLAIYAPSGRYDSVHVVWNNGEHDGVDSFFGLGGIFINNGTTTFSSLISGQGFFWTGQGEAFGEPFLHEWLHGVCRFYASLGYVMPDQDADGAGSHGYTKSPTEGWMSYYRDLMQGRVLEPRLSRFTGITKEAWGRGTPTQRCQ